MFFTARFIIISAIFFALSNLLSAGNETIQTRLYLIESGDKFNNNIDTIINNIKSHCQKTKKETLLIYDKSTSVLVATDTVSNLAIIEKILPENIEANRSQVYLEATFICIPESELRKYTNWNVLTSQAKVQKSDYNKILESDKTVILASAGVLTRNGEEATIRVVAETYLPETWQDSQNILINSGVKKEKDDTESSETPQKEKKYSIFTDRSAIKIKLKDGDRAILSPIPEFGETTELGMRLTFTPTVDRKNGEISIKGTPVLQFQDGWSSFSLQQGQKIKMPIVSALTVTTEPRIKSGEAIIIGGNALPGVSDKNKNEHTLLLLTATMVRADGKVLSGKTIKPNLLFKRIYSGKPLKIVFSNTMKEEGVQEGEEDEDEDDFFNPEGTFDRNSGLSARRSSSIKSILRTLNLLKGQVAISTLFLQINSADLAKITGKRNQIGLPVPDLCNKILNSGKAKLLGNPKLIVRAGEEGTFRLVKEVYFPESWGAPAMGVKDDILYYTGTYPEFGSGSDLGIRLIATPRISPSGTFIDLSLNPQVVECKGWTTFVPTFEILKASGEKEIRKNLIKMPITGRTDLMSNVFIKNGATICVGKGVENNIDSKGEAGSMVTYVFLKADIVDYSGQKSE